MCPGDDTSTATREPQRAHQRRNLCTLMRCCGSCACAGRATADCQSSSSAARVRGADHPCARAAPLCQTCCRLHARLLPRPLPALLLLCKDGFLCAVVKCQYIGRSPAFRIHVRLLQCARARAPCLLVGPASLLCPPPLPPPRHTRARFCNLTQLGHQCHTVPCCAKGARSKRGC